MILTGDQIERSVERGEITIEPFNKDQISTNSYDFRLGNRLRVYNEETLDSRKNNETSLYKLPADGMMLQPSRLYLINTEEVIGSKRYVPIIRGRSSIGRLGLFINITADLIDLGAILQYTLQLHCVQPVKIFPGMLIGQVTFWKTYGRRTLYSGKYAALQSPVQSLSHQDVTL